jgi:hypothetical protein
MLGSVRLVARYVDRIAGITRRSSGASTFQAEQAVCGEFGLTAAYASSKRNRPWNTVVSTAFIA